MGPGGALEALIEARERGLVRFLGVTGHGTNAPAMHLRSLERYAFDAVLFPYNFAMLAQPQYAADVQRLLDVCRERGVATQTIKSIARRRWQGEDGPRFSWYEPLIEEEAIEKAVRWTLGVPGLFVNTSSDARLLPTILEAAASAGDRLSDETMRDEVERHAIEPLFLPGQDGI